MAKKTAKPMKPFVAPAPAKENANPWDSLELAINNAAQQVMQTSQRFLQEEAGNRITENNSFSLISKLNGVLQQQLGAALNLVRELKPKPEAPANENTDIAPEQS